MTLQRATVPSFKLVSTDTDERQVRVVRSVTDYEEHTHTSHIWSIPDTYIGSADQELRSDYLFDLTTGKLGKYQFTLPQGVERIFLEIISNSDNEGVVFSVETDTKNQNKTTIKINSKSGVQIASKVIEPEHESVRKEMDRGRLLFYVTFKGGTAVLDVNNLRNILGIGEVEF